MVTRGLFLACLTATLVVAAPASALVVHPTTEVSHSFTGAACGSVDSLVVPLPRNATNPQILFPQVGELLPSDDDAAGNPVVATITNASTDRLGGVPAAGFQATGSDDVCTNPANYATEGWATDEIDVRVRFTQRVRTFVRGIGEGSARRRPARLHVGIGVLSSLSWRSWDGRIARGRGLGPGGEPVRVRLSRPRDCGLWRYLTVGYRYTGTVPEGARRSRRVRLDATCR